MIKFVVCLMANTQLNYSVIRVPAILNRQQTVVERQALIRHHVLQSPVKQATIGGWLSAA
jgi:hypothetical protein